MSVAEMMNSKGLKEVLNWLQSTDRTAFDFQIETWQYIRKGESGLVNAPTGCGKTFSVFLGAIIRFIDNHPENFKSAKNSGLQVLWITPLRALANDIARAMEAVIEGVGLQWKIGIRNGDTSIAERKNQKFQMPEVLIITPESLHLLLAQKGNTHFFSELSVLVVDEWHELLGSKRGVQVELAISRIFGSRKEIDNDTCNICIWGLSATIGNLNEAKTVLLSPTGFIGKIVKTNMEKQTEIVSVFPDEIEKLPWSGHLGLKLISKIIPIIQKSKTTLIFINTRGMAEVWYHALLNNCPDLAGVIALHHGSIDRELRNWIEENLSSGNLKVVVCTASLDLGVDFRPVETVIQVGSPKGVARFLQRAGRSGHQPDAVSRIYFLPTHSLELLEAAALKAAVVENVVESREPRLMCFDVLIQYLNTLAVGDGFHPDLIFNEVKATFCFSELTRQEFDEVVYFISQGGKTFREYDEFKKVEKEGELYKINNRNIAMRHRLHIGTIVSDSMLKVKFVTGGYVGVIEEYFISRLGPGDVFSLAGFHLEYVMIKEMTVLVRKSSIKKAKVPSWNGGRMPLSANLGKKLRQQMNFVSETKSNYIDELKILQPLFVMQQELSHVPKENELLIEHIETKDGFHLFVYPFEGRLVHEAMAAILAYRISRICPITFSFAMNDYGFELLSDQPIPVDDTNVYHLFSTHNLLSDIQSSINSSEMARRKFRDISVIGGLVFQGMPGEKKKARHLQASASLLFNVLSEYDSSHLLLNQAYNEVMEQQMEEQRLREMLERVQQSKIIISHPKQLTPFCFPIKVDSMREDLSSEKLEDRVRKMQIELGA
ncbi:MAG TPA: ligase-associated DNA damage response DEXH box helicase [Chitinophagaceae bacterium]|jgi:ATP-dependent Lhr-like helicase|nr:ligase-associated DNA damage response DEXH box helicase [Chitinophagaceae bacterium]HNF45523.1 ligase-associated DNA damage response DEXH box helicase [Chitinophagaceae bacterium]HNJ25104.1 ligase-associated DNA damage response DEXH box helicase [Chitinophagaceae bacterium]HNL58714.1 ligase-associated DNA damage response DEXH box helicase [Chitinophagaceae bacterium]HRF23382.1 ligase-associated DNA damage response DEXH box helicase [Chitinophagaceae bacterium]